ncbi:MAG: metalloregulator ArsR/SmtB family transcription factor [Actinomycetota bacterium]
MLQQDVDVVFRALADPTRRRMLELLDEGPATISQLAEPFDVSLTSITQHVRVLERSQLISTTKQGRSRICSLDRRSIERARSWLDDRRSRWERRVDRLAEHLDAHPDPGDPR